MTPTWGLPTEGSNPRTEGLDGAPTLDFLLEMNAEDRRVPAAVGERLEDVARAVDGIAERLRRGGRLHYFGAGTSGRLAVLDAVECPPTFGVPPDRVVPHLAGGIDAFTEATEPAEDDEAQGTRDAEDAALGPDDAVVGVTASGRTPYVMGALAVARRCGALAVALTGAPGSAAGAAADVAIEVATGAEVVAGSTRLKAGTAQKLVLNMLSTGVFRSLGHVYRGRMVDVLPGNEKLRLRAAGIVAELTGIGREEAIAALDAAGGSARRAIAMVALGLPREAAEARLAAAGGRLDVLLPPRGGGGPPGPEGRKP